MSTTEVKSTSTRKPKTKFVKTLSLNPTEAKVLAIVLTDNIRGNAAKDSGDVTNAVYTGVLEGIVAKLA